MKNVILTLDSRIMLIEICNLLTLTNLPDRLCQCVLMQLNEQVITYLKSHACREIYLGNDKVNIFLYIYKVGCSTKLEMV